MMLAGRGFYEFADRRGGGRISKLQSQSLSVGLCVVSTTCERVLLQVIGFGTGLDDHTKKKKKKDLVGGRN